MSFFTRQGSGRALLVAAAIAVWVGFASGVSAQGYDSAAVPFLVNVNATVSATDGTTPKQISVTGNQEATLRLPIQKTLSVLDGVRGQINAPAIISNFDGKVTVSLPTLSYKKADVLLYTVNGKRIFGSNVSISNTVNNITHPNLATGIYVLSVRGTDGNIVTSRLTHSGGGLNINVVFGSEGLSSGKRLAKEAANGEWTITVSASGYVDTVYTLRPVVGTNPHQNITLREIPQSTYLVTVSSSGSGASGGGNYPAGATVIIKAGTAPFGQQFTNWTTTSSGVIFTNANSETTAFTMPPNAVTVTAEFVIQKGTFTDTRNNKTYKTVKIGNQTWMAENLNYSTEDSWCSDPIDNTCSKYGRLYVFKSARSACPSGWHLPSRQEWDNLGQAVGGERLVQYLPDENVSIVDWLSAGKLLKATTDWSNYNGVYGGGSDDYGFSALPGGLVTYNTKEEEWQGSAERGRGFWWSNQGYGNCGGGYVRMMESENNDLMERIFTEMMIDNVRCSSVGAPDYGALGASVRCVKD